MNTSRRNDARGAASNPKSRFTPFEYVLDPLDDPEHEPSGAPTVFLRDDSQTIIAHNQSPDVGFESSINVYRGCEHGCAYCFARPTHEYLGLSLRFRPLLSAFPALSSISLPLTADPLIAKTN